MAYASMGDFFQILITFILIYFALKLLFKFLGPVLMRYALRKMGQKAEEQFKKSQGFTADYSQPKEGKTTIENQPKTNRRVKKDVGEYIDYEEID